MFNYIMLHQAVADCIKSMSKSSDAKQKSHTKPIVATEKKVNIKNIWSKVISINFI